MRQPAVPPAPYTPSFGGAPEKIVTSMPSDMAIPTGKVTSTVMDDFPVLPVAAAVFVIFPAAVIIVSKLFFEQPTQPTQPTGFGGSQPSAP